MSGADRAFTAADIRRSVERFADQSASSGYWDTGKGQDDMETHDWLHDRAQLLAAAPELLAALRGMLEIECTVRGSKDCARVEAARAAIAAAEDK